MDIPESAREAGISAMHSLPEVYWAREGATAAVEAAAPHIDKAARIDELREQAKYLRKVAMDSPVGNGFSPGLLAAANWHEADADRLEDEPEEEDE